MANTPQPPRPSAWSEPGAPDPDLLAAVVLHTLVSRIAGMTLAEVAVACERDPANAADRGEVERALAILRADELATRDDGLWRPTRAAVRAAELSF